MSDITISPTGHYGFQNFGSDYWLGSSNGRILPSSNEFQWRLSKCSNFFYIQDWTTYSCLFLKINGTLGLDACSFSANDAKWDISGNASSGYVLSNGPMALIINDDSQDQVSLRNDPSNSDVEDLWSIDEVDETQWVSSPGPAPDLCSTSPTTVPATITANNYYPSAKSTSASVQSTGTLLVDMTTSAISVPATSTNTELATVTSAAPASETTTSLSAGHAKAVSFGLIAAIVFASMVAQA